MGTASHYSSKTLIKMSDEFSTSLYSSSVWESSFENFKKYDSNLSSYSSSVINNRPDSYDHDSLLKTATSTANDVLDDVLEKRIPPSDSPLWNTRSEDVHQLSHSAGHTYAHGNPSQYAHPQATMNMPYGPSYGQRVDPMVSFLGTFPCLRLISFPQDLAMTEILCIFENHYVLDVVPLAYPTAQGGVSLYGDVFILFSTISDSARALQSVKGKPVRVQTSYDIRQFHIQIEPASREQYYHAVSASVNVSIFHIAFDMVSYSHSTLNLLILQPPHKKVSPEYSYEPPPVHFGMSGAQYSDLNYRGGMHSYGMESPAIHNRSAQNMGRRNMGRGGSGRGGGIRSGEHTGYIRMRGLPFDRTKEQILEFFEGCNVIPDSVCLAYRSDGRVTGEGYIAFETPDDAKAAMQSHHKRMMGSRYIELFISNKDELDRAKDREPSEESLKSFSKMNVK